MNGTETFLDGRVTLHPGDCLDVLARLPECSIDSCVTDPPYHLTSIVKRFGAEGAAPAKSGKSGVYARSSRGFMGKQWDGGEIAFEPETWVAVLRVLKPGGHLLAFGAPKNFGFMQYAIAQAGFEIRDVLAWIFGSGFPKSHNVGNGWGTALKPAYEPIIMARKPLIGTVAQNVLAHGTGAINVDGCRIATDESTVRPFGAQVGSRENGYGFVGASSGGSTSGRWPANIIHDGSEEVLALFPSSKGQQGDVRGDEPSKPMGGGAVFGAMNGRVPQAARGDSGSAARFFASFPESDRDKAWKIGPASYVESSLSLQSEAVVSALRRAAEASTLRLALRFQNYRAPSTTVTASEFAEIETLVTAAIQNLERRSWRGLPLERLSLTGSHASIVAAPKPTGITTITISLSKSNGFAEPVTFDITETSAEAGASGCAKRFYYTSKADADDRIGSRHPTVKPVDLMQWLVRLVTPPGGLVLDPFAGTGTTGEAAFREGMRAVLIEREAEYQADIRRRMALVLAGPDERRHETLKAAGKVDVHDNLPLFAGN